MSTQNTAAKARPTRQSFTGDEGDVSGAKYCFHPEVAKGNGEYRLNVARKRRSGEWVVKDDLKPAYGLQDRLAGADPQKLTVRNLWAPIPTTISSTMAIRKILLLHPREPVGTGCQPGATHM